jgi:prepilin-type N-terminal cleavage/methylation domain-containing protein
MKNKDLKLNSGFTLIETLVALSIFTISIVGLISATAGGLNNVTYSKNKITAMALSAEGVELVRNLRDTKALTSDNGWSDFLSAVNMCSVNCNIDAESLDINTAISPCTTSVCYINRHDNGSSPVYFGYSPNGTPTPFWRIIKITAFGADEVEVISTVNWVQGSGIKSVTTTEHLFNWFQVPAPVTP